MAAPYLSGPPPPLDGGSPRAEIWMEAKSPDGKVYYYHSVTRATSWTLPPGAQLMKPQIDGGGAGAATVQQQAAADGVGQQQQAAPGTGSVVTAQNAVAQAQAASQYQIGSTLNQASVPSLSMSQQPVGVVGGMPHPGALGQMPGAMMGHHGMPNPAMFGMPPGMGFPPPSMGFAQHFMPPGMLPHQARGDAADWNEYLAQDGRSYWYNSKLSQTAWEKPPEVAEYELKKKNEPAPVQAKPTEDKLAAAAGDAKKDTSTKPIATKQIPGTPWCVVWTSDKKSFFHNPSTKASVWKRPPELLGLKEVDDLIGQIPEEAVVEPAKLKSTTNGETVGSKREAKDVNDENSAKRLRAGSLDDASPDNLSEASSDVPASSHRVGQQLKVAVAPKEKPKDPAYEAELKAAKDRELIPLDERIAKFKELLAEKDVSAYSTWEKELHKIVFDPRYLLLTSKDRRDVFDEFTKEKAEKEREDKKKKISEVRDSFKQLLREANITSKTSFNDFCSKFGKDERYRNIERMKEREQFFEDYMYEVRKKEKEQRIADREKIRLNFVEMLQELPGLSRKSHWSDIKKKIREDPRYERIDSSNQREEWFRDFVKTLAKKKDKESDEEKVEEEDEKVKQDREKNERTEASIRERERQVQEELSTIKKDTEKEREHHRFDEAVQHYKALLTDLIRQTDLTYKEARKILKKDARYELADPLSKHQKEEIYDEHLDALSAKKKQSYRELLEEVNVALDSNWKEIRRKIKEDVRYSKFSSSDTKCEKEFHKYIRDKTANATAEFRELLTETKLLDFKTKSRIESDSDPSHMKDLIEILKNDKRYLILEPIARERKDILMKYIEELARRGPPPPPTASEPSRRSGK